MTIQLSEFKAKLVDACRPNRFLILFGNTSDDTIMYAAKGSQIPGQNIGEMILNWQGMQTKLAGDPTYDTFSVTFINDYAMKARKFIEDWFRLTKIDPVTNLRHDPREYRQQMNVLQLGRGEDVIGSWELIDAHPITIDPIDLSMDNNDTPSEFSVTFTYDYWVRKI